jgi:hypothetical protein
VGYKRWDPGPRVRSLLGCTGNGACSSPRKKPRVRRVRFLRSLSGKSIRSRVPADFYIFFQPAITERTLTSDSQHQARCARTKRNFTSGGQREHRMALGPLRMLLKKIFRCDDSMVKVNSDALNERNGTKRRLEWDNTTKLATKWCNTTKSDNGYYGISHKQLLPPLHLKGLKLLYRCSCSQ